MKTHAFQSICATLAALALTLGPAFAQNNQPVVVVPIKSTAVVKKTAAGNITKINQHAIFIKADGDAHATGYNITPATTYVDDQGAPAEKANAKIGHAVIITYVVDDGARDALTVVVRNAP